VLNSISSGVIRRIKLIAYSLLGGGNQETFARYMELDHGVDGGGGGEDSRHIA
jgi:hypothetical protein